MTTPPAPPTGTTHHASTPLSFSLQLYTLRVAMAADLPGTLKQVAAIGYTQVEPYDFAATADQLAEAFEANGLRAPSGHAPLLRADQEEIFAAAGRLGIATVIDPFVAPERWTSRDDIEATAAQLNEAARRAADHGIRVGYHNHWWEPSNRLDGRLALEVLADHLDPAVVLEVDTYWATVGGTDPVALLHRLGDRVRFIHIKDGPATTDPADQVALGDGALPIWDIIDAAGALEVAVVELDDTRGDRMQAVADSYAFLTAGR